MLRQLSVLSIGISQLEIVKYWEGMWENSKPLVRTLYYESRS